MQRLDGDRAVLPAVRGFGDDPRHVAAAAAIEEIAVDGVRHERARQVRVEFPSLLDAAECLDVLRPIGDERRIIRRAGRRETDERGAGRADPFDRARAAIHFLDIDTGRQILGHTPLLSAEPITHRAPIAPGYNPALRRAESGPNRIIANLCIQVDQMPHTAASHESPSINDRRITRGKCRNSPKAH